MSDHFTLEKCDLLESDKILEVSNQSNLFCKSFFLNSLDQKFHIWKVIQGQEIKAIVILNVDDSGTKSIENDFVIHNGIFFNLDNKRILVKRREDQFQITEFVINELVKKYETIFLSLDPSIIDVRPFQWFNYNNDGPKFKIEVKYTSILDTSEMKKQKTDEKLKIFKNLEPVRRYSIRQSLKDKAKVEFSKDNLNFLNLYKVLSKKIYKSNYKKNYNVVEKITKNLIDNKSGIFINTRDKKDNLLYSACCGWDNNKAYYLFGAGSEKFKKPWQGTIGQWYAMRYIVEKSKIYKFDFEGVNSPKRGWFKLGFGGDLIPYYQVKYEKY
tara:strand:- start:2418 stop:3398 length:981 start_codon:yes stop_codon:yes gene_type:complete